MMGQNTSSTLNSLANEADSSQGKPPAALAALYAEPPPDTPSTFEFTPPTLSIDDEGYVQSFYPPPPLDGIPDLDQQAPPQYSSLDDIQAFFNEYGFVVIRNVVPEALLGEIRNEIWSKPGLEGLNPANADSWMFADWSKVFGGSYNERHGFLNFALAESQAAQEVRQLPTMHRSFAAVIGRSDLWFKYDRFGLMRPTKGIRISKRSLRKLQLRDDMAAARELLFDEAPIGASAAAFQMINQENIAHLPDDDEVVEVDRPEWQTRSEFVHWDLNPWVEQQFCRVQGVVAVSNHTATSGGFHCIPGFHKKIREWAQVYHERATPKNLVELATPNQFCNLQHITMRPGSVVIWDSRLPHGNWPNDDNTWRMVFYLTYFPSFWNNPDILSARQAMVSYMNPVTYSDLGKWVAGLEQYPQELQATPEQAAVVNLQSKHNLGQWGLG